MHRLKRISSTVVRIIAILSIVAIGVMDVPGAAFAQSAQPGITSPSPGSAISGNVPVFGTAQIDPFQKYELHYKLEPSGDDAYIYFDGSTTPVVNGQLGVWMAAGLPPGTYSLRLRVVKQDGNYAEYFAPNLSVNQGPVPTATPDEPTPTPIPTVTFTPAPQPTPVVGQVEQPILEEPPTATPDAAAALTITQETQPPVGIADAAVAPDVAVDTGSTSVTRELGEALSISRLRTSFMNGVRISAALLLGVVALYAGKKLFTWVWVQFT